MTGTISVFDRKTKLNSSILSKNDKDLLNNVINFPLYKIICG